MGFINFQDEHQYRRFKDDLVDMFMNNEIVILCVGTDRCTGDSLGPLVGHMLEEYKDFNIPIYGTLKYPVHAANLEVNIKHIRSKYSKSSILAIDACLGNTWDIGKIAFCNKPITPGSGCGKKLDTVGKYSIIGAVNIECDEQHYDILQSTRLYIVWAMAKAIAEGLYHSYKSALCKNENVVNYF